MQADGIDPISDKTPPRNLILAGLSPSAFEKLKPYLSRINLPQATVLVKPGRDIQWIYFLEHGMASMNSFDLTGTPVEVGIIGHEGIVGVQAVLGQSQTQNTIVMQGAGEGYRIRADLLREHIFENSELLKAVHTFVYALLEQTTQLVLCNRLHELEARLARWLLMSSDFMETRLIRLTQEYLAEMLGVGRPAVTIAAGILQRSGLITYSRGRVEIVDRERLGKVACECYGIIRHAYEKVYPAFY